MGLFTWTRCRYTVIISLSLSFIHFAFLCLTASVVLLLWMYSIAHCYFIHKPIQSKLMNLIPNRRIYLHILCIQCMPIIRLVLWKCVLMLPCHTNFQFYWFCYSQIISRSVYSFDTSFIWPTSFKSFSFIVYFSSNITIIHIEQFLNWLVERTPNIQPNENSFSERGT